MKVYPIFLNRLDEKKTVVIGGNYEAERKTRELLDCDARITIISPEVTDYLLGLFQKKEIRWIKREYQEGDLVDAFLVIVTEYHSDTNEKVFNEAERQGILVNVMDDAAHCNFTFGSILKQGPLTLSISTSGSAPALAVRLRERFEREFGREYDRFLCFARKLRGPMARHHHSFSERRKLWYELVDSDVIELLRDNKNESAYKRASEIVGVEVVKETLEIGEF